LYAGAATAGLRRELLACRAGAFDSYIEAADIGANIELGGRISRLRQETGRGRTGGSELRLCKSSHFLTFLLDARAAGEHYRLGDRVPGVRRLTPL
jgi:hypothetical protein